jgi:hypothetical protein
MGRTNGCNIGRVPRSRKPVMDRGPDGASLDRQIAGATVTGNQ